MISDSEVRPHLELYRFGEVGYQTALDLQLHLRGICQSEKDRYGFVLCLEHPPVVTLGKRGKESDLISPKSLEEFGVEIFHVDRGGEATYHGPGQLIVYPIVNLKRLGLGVVDLVRGLARILSDTVADVSGVELVYDAKHPGLWTVESPARKMASVGMRVSGGISTHGAALNLTTNLIPFSYIVACGIANAPMTRLQDYVEHEIVMSEFVDLFLPKFAQFLKADFVDGTTDLGEFGPPV